VISRSRRDSRETLTNSWCLIGWVAWDSGRQAWDVGYTVVTEEKAEHTSRYDVIGSLATCLRASMQPRFVAETEPVAGPSGHVSVVLLG
jgi:hypothetical protein